MTLFNFETELISLRLDSSFPHVHFFIIVFNKMYFNYLFLSKSSPQGLWVPEVRDFGLLIFPLQVTQKSEYSVERDERRMSTVVIPTSVPVSDIPFFSCALPLHATLCPFKSSQYLATLPLSWLGLCSLTAYSSTCVPDTTTFMKHPFDLITVKWIFTHDFQLNSLLGRFKLYGSWSYLPHGSHISPLSFTADPWFSFSG